VVQTKEDMRRALLPGGVVQKVFPETPDEVLFNQLTETL
jgi:hypothetical protein